VQLAARFRAGDPLTPTGGAKRALVAIARRWHTLDTEIRDLNHAITGSSAAAVADAFGETAEAAAALADAIRAEDEIAARAGRTQARGAA